MPRDPEAERDLQLLLRNIAAGVLLSLLGVVILMALVVPVVAPAVAQDTTLLLGLSGSLLGALLMLLGLQASLIRGNGK
jgi:VIT1/CCC1 family predicted Fe2+/Mn2+ transporter